MAAPQEDGSTTEPRSEFEKEPHYALISVSDKTGISDLARVLNCAGYTIISTGGTGRALAGEGISFTPIEKITGNPESFEGRMKTISFPVEGGILFDRSKPEHIDQAQNLGVPCIDIVVCNLYPFEQTVGGEGVTLDEAIESIDVGGPTMVRAAAKNFKHVLVVTDPNDYGRVADVLPKGAVTEELRQELAAKAFRHLSFYDAQIAKFLGKEQFPKELTIPLRRGPDLRYGDNPDQTAVWYVQPGVDSPLQHLEQLAGRGLSETNLTDIQMGIMAVRQHDEPAAAIIKHNSPCGIAAGAEVLRMALEADPESAFGGVVVLNRPMRMADVEAIAAFKQEGRGQMDIIAAPSFEEGVVEALTAIRKTTGVYAFGELPPQSPDGLLYRWVDGGVLVEEENNPEARFDQWKVVVGDELTDPQLAQARLGWKFASRVRSNTVVVMDPDLPMTRGIGSGQTSRVRAARIALEQAKEHARGALLISDGFLPMSDTVELAKAHGIKIIVQPGGSISDEKVIEAAREAGITMVFTGQRLFWH